jgi:hypothetical protein
MKRSLGIALIAIVQFIISGLSVVSGLVLLLLITGRLQILSTDLTNLPLYLKGLTLLGLVISLLGVIVSYGLWRLRRWGWIGSLIFQGLCIANNSIVVIAGQPPSFGVYFSAVLAAGTILVLCLPSVREVFLLPTSHASSS